LAQKRTGYPKENRQNKKKRTKIGNNRQTYRNKRALAAGKDKKGSSAPATVATWK